MTRAQQKAEALRILAGCAAGATEASLAGFGVTRAALDALVAEGRITTRNQTLAKPKGLVVAWFHLVPDRDQEHEEHEARFRRYARKPRKVPGQAQERAGGVGRAAESRQAPIAPSRAEPRRCVP